MSINVTHISVDPSETRSATIVTAVFWAMDRCRCKLNVRIRRCP